MISPKSFEDLEVWKRAIDLTHAIYAVSGRWPADERFGITQQIRRAAASVAANVAEGAERDGTKEFLRFLSIANGSLAETQTFLVIAQRLGYLDAENAGDLRAKLQEVRKMLAGLKRSLQARLTDHRPLTTDHS